ncbi:MAG: hypothetical protein QM784_04465 [Polyangiaceae bacterium]
MNKLGNGELELVVPSQSILAEPPVAVVDKYARKHGTEVIAKAYLEYLYAPEAQRLAAKHYYRPWDEGALREAGSTFAKLELFTIDEVFSGWSVAQRTHFDDGGEFDKLYQPSKKVRAIRREFSPRHSPWVRTDPRIHANLPRPRRAATDVCIGGQSGRLGSDGAVSE